jgi:hypothetical protein
LRAFREGPRRSSCGPFTSCPSSPSRLPISPSSLRSSSAPPSFRRTRRAFPFELGSGRTGNVCSIYRKRPTSLSILLRGLSSRSASVSSCPHSQSKKVRAERQTDSGPPSTTFSPHSSQRRTTCLPEPSISTPSASFYLCGRHPLTLIWSPQGEPASTMRDLCFTRYCLNPQLRFHLAR